MRQLLAIAILFLTATIPMLAHEGHAHPILGTVTMLHENHLMMKTAEGKELTFTLGAETKYIKGDKPATKDEITEGVRVSVQLSEDGKNVAVVKIGDAKKK